MCLAIYIASEKPLPLVAWDERAPAFHVVDLSEGKQVVRGQFLEPNVYYVGAYEGCGCAFNYGREYPGFEDDPEALKSAGESVAGLADYLKAAAAAGGSLHIFSCWEGEEGKAPEYYREVTADEVRASDFVFRVPELLTIRGGV